MVRIWARVTRGDKIVKDMIYQNEQPFDKKHFEGYVREICHALDIETPIVLGYNVNNFDKFNITRFAPDCFVDAVDFDFLVLENAPLDKSGQAKGARHPLNESFDI